MSIFLLSYGFGRKWTSQVLLRLVIDLFLSLSFSSLSRLVQLHISHANSIMSDSGERQTSYWIPTRSRGSKFARTPCRSPHVGEAATIDTIHIFGARVLSLSFRSRLHHRNDINDCLYAAATFCIVRLLFVCQESEPGDEREQLIY